MSLTLTEKIKAAFDASGMTYAELARELGWTQPSTWRQMNGKTSIKLSDVMQICAALRVRIDIEAS